MQRCSPPRAPDPAPASTDRVLELETLRPPVASLREALASRDVAVAHAAAKALARRFDEGVEAPAALAEGVPGDLLALPAEVQLLLADLVVRGLPVVAPRRSSEASPDFSPELAVGWRRAQFVSDPASLPAAEVTELDLRAVAGVPVERALATGLLARLVEHSRPACHDVALDLLQAAIERALLPPDVAQRHAWSITLRSTDAVAVRALRLLARPWAHALPCPARRDPHECAEEVAVASVHLAAARGDVARVRGWAASDAASRTARRAALAALGPIGDASDVELILGSMEVDPPGFGPEGADALRALKRRGFSANEEAARRAVALVFRCDLVGAEVIAEALSSRADALVAAIDRHLAEGASRAKGVALLEAFGTRRTIARLGAMAADAANGVLGGLAIRALGRLGERDAEPLILARLDADPDACLFALARVGGGATVRRLRDALADPSPPPWMADALGLLLRLDPAPDVLAAAATRGALTDTALDALPTHASRAQVDVLATIAGSPGHPLREAAIRALGRTGGLAAIDPLAALLTDPDEATRDAAKGALRGLGDGLNTAEPPLAFLEGASDPGGAIVAEAALRRLRLRPEDTAETALLLDGIVGVAHPHLVRLVRPLLRRESMEIRKRAVACLAAAGPACVPWLLPCLSDARLPVARQALLAIGAARVPGLGRTLAPWLEHRNMNLKKAAAEALARCRDPAVIAALAAALAGNDQPGFRALIEAALRALAGPFFRSVLVEMLAAEGELRRVELLADALASELSPRDLAALVALRPTLPWAPVLRAAYCAGAGPLAGKSGELDAELRRRGCADRIPRASDVPLGNPQREGLLRSDVLRSGGALRRALGEAPFGAGIAPALLERIRVMGAQPPSFSGLSVPEQRVLAALLPDLDLATRADAIAILAPATDPAVRERVLPHVALSGDPDPRHARLLAAAMAHQGTAVARALANGPDRAARARAAEVLRLAGESELVRASAAERPSVLRAWLDAGRDDEVLAAVDAPGGPSLVEVAKVAAERAGAARAMELAERWVARGPSTRSAALVDLAFLGEPIEPALHAIVRGDGPAELRVSALGALVTSRAADIDLLRRLLGDAHAALRERAALEIVRAGDHEDRARVVDAWLAGAFTGRFSLALGAEDAAAVERAVAAATTEIEQMRLLEPVSALDHAWAVPLLLALWASPHARVEAKARERLRGYPPSRVLPFIEARLAAGDLAPLDVLGAQGCVPPRWRRSCAPRPAPSRGWSSRVAPRDPGSCTWPGWARRSPRSPRNIRLPARCRSSRTSPTGSIQRAAPRSFARSRPRSPARVASGSSTRSSTPSAITPRSLRACCPLS